MRRHATAWAITGAVGLVWLAGCGGGPATGDVSGTASFDGVPIEDGHINFIPADGKGSTAGGIIKDGKYDAKKVPVGAMKVSVSGSKIVGKKKIYDTPNSPEMPLTKDFIPEKYSDMEKTELRYDVQSGRNEKNWDLKSK
jgi:hypothetical protein